MANLTAVHAKGRNVAPISSVLNIQTRGVDVSGFTYAPEDGEWIIYKGEGKAASQTAGDITADSNKLGMGSMLRMVWSEKGRSDIQSLNRTKVPVIWMGPLHCKLALYDYDDTNALSAGHAAEIRAGMPITVAANTVSVNGSTSRLVAQCSTNDLASGYHWVVGHVVAPPAVAGDPVEVYLFDCPRLVTRTA